MLKIYKFNASKICTLREVEISIEVKHVSGNGTSFLQEQKK